MEIVYNKKNISNFWLKLFYYLFIKYKIKYLIDKGYIPEKEFIEFADKS